jgi:hypothetical protein
MRYACQQATFRAFFEGACSLLERERERERERESEREREREMHSKSFKLLAWH